MSMKSYAQQEFELRRELERARNELRDTVVENKRLTEELKQKNDLVSILYSEINEYQRIQSEQESKKNEQEQENEVTHNDVSTKDDDPVSVPSQEAQEESKDEEEAEKDNEQAESEYEAENSETESESGYFNPTSIITEEIHAE